MTTGAPAAHRHARQTDQTALRRLLDWAVAKRLHVALAALIVLAVSLHQNVSDIHKTPYHPDESRWLNRAYYTEMLLHPLSSTWEDRYLTRGQPPGGSYITGIGLLVQGRDLKTNGAWNFHYGGESTISWNASRGNMPSWDDLEATRRTSAALGTLTALTLFAIVARMTNVIGGVVGGVFFAVHPLSVYLSTLGVSDAAFTCMVALSALAAMALAAKPTWARTAVLGVLLGIGAATKLSPLFLAIGLAAIGAVLVAEPWLRQARPLRWLVDRIPGFSMPHGPRLGWMLLCVPVITLGTFIASYPFLWPDPVGRTRTLFEFRRYEMNNQARIWPHASIDTRFEALQRTWTMLEDRYSASGKGVAKIADYVGGSTSERGIDLPFAIIGLAIVLLMAFQRGITSPTFLALAVVGGQALLIVGGLRVDFDRYYLPVVLICAIGLGALGAWVWTNAVSFVPTRFGRRRRQARPAANLAPRPASTHQSAD